MQFFLLVTLLPTMMFSSHWKKAKGSSRQFIVTILNHISTCQLMGAEFHSIRSADKKEKILEKLSRYMEKETLMLQIKDVVKKDPCFLFPILIKVFST